MFKQESTILPCTSCQAKYNVTNLPAGSRFKCARCGTINVVPVPEDAATEVVSQEDVAVAQIRQSPPVRQTPPAPAPAVSLKKTTVRLSGQSSPIVSASRPTVRMAQPQTRPQAGTRQSPVTRQPAPRRGVTGGKVMAPARRGVSSAIRRQGTEEPEGIEPKKKSKTLLIIGIVGGVVLLIIVIWAMSSGDKSKEQEAKMLADAEKAAAEKAAAEKEKEKPPEPVEVTPEEPVTTTEPTKVEEPKPTPKKTSKSRLEIDEAVQAEVVPLVREMSKQGDADQKVTIEKITAKGKKAIPVLIEIIGDEDAWAARYAYEVLLKITKRNRDDTTKVNQMLSRDMRKECQKDWEDWWLKNKDTIPD